MDAQTPLRRDLPSLTSLRAFAALLVLVFHLSRWDVLELPGAGVGETGVAFFFVLSGFLLTWGYSGRLRPFPFYLRRFARIYPSHAVVWLVVLVLPITVYPVTWWTAAANLPLMQAWVPSERWVFGMNGVTWSLACEVAFYAAFPAVLWWSARGKPCRLYLLTAVSFAAECATVLVSVWGDTPAWVALAGFASPLFRFPEFLMGVAAATAVRAGWRLRPAVAVVVVAACLAALAAVHERPVDNVWLAPIYLVAILAGVQLDLNRPRSLLTARPLVYLGKVSFTFYLVHELVIINMRPLTGSGTSAAMLDLAIALAAAVGLHHAVEVPSQRGLVRTFDSGKRATSGDPATS